MTKQDELRITKEQYYRLLTSPTAHLYIWYQDTIKDMERKIKRLERQLKKVSATP